LGYLPYFQAVFPRLSTTFGRLRVHKPASSLPEVLFNLKGKKLC
jgi:hypothetical protein